MGRLGPVTALSTDWQVIAPGDVLARIGSRYCGVGGVACHFGGAGGERAWSAICRYCVRLDPGLRLGVCWYQCDPRSSLLAYCDL